VDGKWMVAVLQPAKRLLLNGHMTEQDTIPAFN